MDVRRIAAASLALSLTVASSLAGAQTTSGGWTTPRTADGQPDLGGVWDFRTITPLQRPRNQDKAVLTEEEAAELEQRVAERVARADAPSEVRTEPLPAGQPVGGYNNFWLDRGGRVVEDRRTSLIVDPPTGRVPELQPGALRQVGLTGRGPAERAASPLQVGWHLPGRPRRPRGGGALYRGEDDTLVIETENFSDLVASFNAGFTVALGTGTTLHLTERFTRVDHDTLRYEFTVDDPETFTQPIR